MRKFCVGVFLACGFGSLLCVNCVRGSRSLTSHHSPQSTHFASLISHHHLTPLISFISSHNMSHTQTSHTTHLTHLTQHVTYTLISHHSSLTTHLPPLISHHSALTTHLPPSYTTHLPYLTPFVSHRPSHPLAISSSH